jgi:hypothetical protein
MVERKGSEVVSGRRALDLGNVAHALKLVALLLFFLPWVTVSCAEQTLVSVSGMDLATGSVEVTNPLTGENVRPPDGGEAELPVLIALLLVSTTLVVGFVARRPLSATLSIAGLAIAAALIGYSVLLRMPDKARADATAESVEGISQAQIASLIRVEIEIGYWLTLAALLAAIVATFLSRNRPPPGRG